MKQSSNNVLLTVVVIILLILFLRFLNKRPIQAESFDHLIGDQLGLGEVCYDQDIPIRHFPKVKMPTQTLMGPPEEKCGQDDFIKIPLVNNTNLPMNVQLFGDEPSLGEAKKSYEPQLINTLVGDIAAIAATIPIGEYVYLLKYGSSVHNTQGIITMLDRGGSFVEVVSVSDLYRWEGFVEWSGLFLHLPSEQLLVVGYGTMSSQIVIDFIDINPDSPSFNTPIMSSTIIPRVIPINITVQIFPNVTVLDGVLYLGIGIYGSYGGSFNEALGIYGIDMNTGIVLFEQYPNESLHQESGVVVVGKRLYIQTGSTFYVYDVDINNVSYNTILYTVAGPAMPFGGDYIITSLNNKVYVAYNLGCYVYDISDLNNPTYLTAIVIGFRPMDVTFHEDKLYIIGATDDNYYIVDTNTDTVISTILIGANLRTFGILIKGDVILVNSTPEPYLSNDSQIIVFDLLTNVPITTMIFPGAGLYTYLSTTMEQSINSTNDFYLGSSSYFGMTDVLLYTFSTPSQVSDNSSLLGKFKFASFNPIEVCSIKIMTLTQEQLFNVLEIVYHTVMGSNSSYKITPMDYKNANTVNNIVFIDEFPDGLILDGDHSIKYTINPYESVLIFVYPKKSINRKGRLDGNGEVDGVPKIENELSLTDSTYDEIELGVDEIIIEVEDKEENELQIIEIL